MWLRVLICVVIVCGVLATIAPKEKNKKRAKATDPKPSSRSGDTYTSSVPSSQLSPEELTIQAMLAQNVSTVSVPMRQFSQTVLGYVTPWNNRGYDFAKQLAKFDIIVPVWYQLKRIDGKSEITGLHDTDEGWMADVRKMNPAVRIAPRIIFEGYAGNDGALEALFGSELPQVAIVDKIVKFLQSKSFDGLVCEILLQTGYAYKENSMHFLALLGAKLKENGLILIVPLPPPIRSNYQQLGFFTPEDFNRLSPFVNYFNVMTYDFSTQSSSPGPVSPANWLAQCMIYYTKDLPDQEAQKFLVGINFYGMEYGGQQIRQPIISNRYLEIIGKYPDAKLIWDPESAEHILQFGRNFVVYYPTLHSIKLRLQIAEHLKCGVAIWDMGQGLDHFYNLF